jgi:hypothetical protein
MANPPMAESPAPTIVPTPKDETKQDNKPAVTPDPPETKK